MLAGWGLSNETPPVQPENLKILHVKIYEKSKCVATPAIERSNEFICAGVPGKRFQAACDVSFLMHYV